MRLCMTALSTCWSQAEFTTATKLQLTGVATTVQSTDKYEEGMTALHTPQPLCYALR